MNVKKAKRAVRMVAKKHGISEKQVVSDIEAAITEALTNAQREKNREVIARWKEIPRQGEVPTAYELLAYLEERVRSFPKTPNS